MTPPRFLSVCGVCCEADVETMHRAADRMPEGIPLFAGVLASARTLEGERSSNRRYPLFSEVGALLDGLGAHPRLRPAVHFNTRAIAPLFDEQLQRVVSVSAALRAVQLNVVQPEPWSVACLRASAPHVDVILQVGPVTVGAAEPEAVHRALRAYVGSVQYALLDLSRGENIPLDVDWVRACLAAWEHNDIAPVVAGGLGPDAGETLRALYATVGPEVFSRLSFDAESAVRSPCAAPRAEARGQDDLDRDKTLRFVDLMVEAMTGADLSADADRQKSLAADWSVVDGDGLGDNS